MGSQILAKGRYIKKHNAAIRSYSEMTLLQKKIANNLLYHAYHELVNKDFHEITISQLLSLLEMKTKDYQKIKQCIRQLMTTVIEWNVINQSEHRRENINNRQFTSNENWKACTLLSSVHIDGPIIRYEYSRILRELFYRPSLYSKISLSIQNKFQSGYALSLYETCLSYLNCGVTGWIRMDSFRKIMGVKEAEYSIFRDFNRRVLKPSVLEVNKTSDITISYEIRKSQRSYALIKFFIQRKKIETENIAIGNEDSILTNKLINYGASKKQIESWIKQYSREYILEKIELIEGSKTEVNNFVAFLNAALNNDYKRGIAKSTMKQQNSIIEYCAKREAEEKREQLKKKYQDYLENIYKEWVCRFNTEERKYLVDKMKSHFEASAFILPFWKKAKLKLDLIDWSLDRDILMSVKVFVSLINENSGFKLKLPEVKTFDEYLIEFG